jgi:hypothetical protein
MSTVSAIAFGMALAWTPSAVLLAILLWNDQSS